MRYIITCFIAIFFIKTALAQVGIGTQNPNTSAQLDVTSTNKGLLPPRMTSAQRDAIPNPSPGLMIFNTTTQTLEIFTSYGWAGLQIQIPARKLLGGAVHEEAYSIQNTTDGGYIVAGLSSTLSGGDITGTNHGGELGGNDYWIVKLDGAKNITWNKLLGGDGTDEARSIQQTPDGGYIVAGYSTSSANGDVTEANHGSYDYWIVKLDVSGNIEWNKILGGTGDDKAQSIDLTADGGYIVAGYSNNFEGGGNVSEETYGGYDYWVVKLDNGGNIIWDNLMGGTGDDVAYSIQQASDGNYIIAGNSASSASNDVTGINHGTASFPTDCWIVRLNASGTVILWNKLLGGSKDDEAQSIEQTPDGGYIVAGFSGSSNNGDVSGINHDLYFNSPDYWIIKLDRFGNITWDKLLGGELWEKAYSIKLTSDGGYIVAGFSTSSANGNVTESNHSNVSTSDYWIVKLDGTGNILWNRLIGGSADDYARAVLQSPDGGYIVAGFTKSSFNGDVTSGNHSGNNDFWIIKLGSTGYLY